MFTTPRTAVVLRRWARRGSILAIVSTLALIGGCVPVVGTGGDGTTGPPGDGDSGDGAATFAVSLQVSNPTPQLLEEVTFRCTPQGAGSDALVFDFQSPDVALQVNSTNGTANFVVSESDLGLTFDVTCRASDGAGRTAQSRRVTVAPTG